MSAQRPAGGTGVSIGEARRGDGRHGGGGSASRACLGACSVEDVSSVALIAVHSSVCSGVEVWIRHLLSALWCSSVAFRNHRRGVGRAGGAHPGSRAAVLQLADSSASAIAIVE